MFCSQCGAEAFGPYCSKCGAKIDAPKSVPENPPQQAAPQSTANTQAKPTILLKSTDCSAFVREAERRTTKILSSTLIVVSICTLCGVFYPNIVAFLTDTRAEFIDSLPLPVLLLLFASLVVDLYIYYKQARKTADIVNKYMEYCSKENLIIDDQKIYGATMQGSVELSYDQISSVTFSTYTSSTNGFLTDPCCDILTIKDNRGKQYTFRSFTNCKEIKSVIDMQLKNIPQKVRKPFSTYSTPPAPVNIKKQVAPIQPQPTEDGEIICLACGKKQPANRKVCWNCGQKFSDC